VVDPTLLDPKVEDPDNFYLVALTIQYDDYEKATLRLVCATDEKQAGIEALVCECLDEPDFTEFPEKDGCWDLGEFIYLVRSVKHLTKEEMRLYVELTRGV
jgi:hypothetical protein